LVRAADVQLTQLRAVFAPSAQQIFFRVQQEKIAVAASEFQYQFTGFIPPQKCQAENAISSEGADCFQPGPFEVFAQEHGKRAGRETDGTRSIWTCWTRLQQPDLGLPCSKRNLQNR
jgi:hypothetical protein